MPEYPLILTLTFEVRRPKFSARVVAHGRALVAFEEGAWWCHGVEPGGLTAPGEDPMAAFKAYKLAFEGVLYDLADDASGFEDFRHAACCFIKDVDNNESERWHSARAEIRAGIAVAEPFSALKRVTDTVVATVQVTELKKMEASQEVVDLAEALPRAA